MGKNEIDKYIELYDLSKQVLDERLQSLRQVEEKASRYISVLGLLLVAYGLGGKFVLEELIPPRDWIDTFPLIVFLIFFALIIYTIFVLFRILDTRRLTHIPMNDEVIKLYSEQTHLNAIYAMTQGISEAVAKNEAVLLDKTARLTKSYRLMLSCIILLSIFISSVVFRSFSQQNSYKTTNLKAIIMTTEDSSKGKKDKQPEKTPDKSKEQKPDTTIKPPKFREFNEDVNPNVNKKNRLDD